MFSRRIFPGRIFTRRIFPAGGDAVPVSLPRRIRAIVRVIASGIDPRRTRATFED